MKIWFSLLVASSTLFGKGSDEEKFLFCWGPIPWSISCWFSSIKCSFSVVCICLLICDSLGEYSSTSWSTWDFFGFLGFTLDVFNLSLSIGNADSENFSGSLFSCIFLFLLELSLRLYFFDWLSWSTLFCFLNEVTLSSKGLGWAGCTCSSSSFRGTFETSSCCFTNSSLCSKLFLSNCKISFSDDVLYCISSFCSLTFFIFIKMVLADPLNLLTSLLNHNACILIKWTLFLIYY